MRVGFGLVSAIPPWPIVACLLGCGRIHFDGAGMSRDGETAASCWPAWSAGTVSLGLPQRIIELSAGNDLGNPAITTDELTLYYDIVTANQEIYMATRATRDAVWSNATTLTELNSTAQDENPDVTDDGLTALFTSGRGGPMQMYYAMRAAPVGPFSVPTQVPVAALNVDVAEHDPEPIGNGLRLYYAAVSGSGTAIQLATRASTTDSFGAGTPVPGLQSAVSRGDPAVSPDELVIVFTQGLTPVDNDLYYAKRSDVGQPFGTAVPVPGVNLPNVDDGDPELTNDGCTLYFDSQRAGTRELYTAEIAQ